MSGDKAQSLYAKLLGRSLTKVLFGNFFENKNNTASILAIALVSTLCYTIIVKDKYEYVNGLLNIVFVIIGYYFGAKQTKTQDEDDNS